jgi:23S rRNA pseudouridine1911/1915/1917 synthase
LISRDTEVCNQSESHHAAAAAEDIVTLVVIEGGERLDRYIARHMPGRSRSEIQRWVRDSGAAVDGARARASQKVQPGQVILIRVPRAQPEPPQAEPIPLDVVYEDDSLLVVNKPAGLVVHPSHGHHTGTLVNALLAHCPDIGSPVGDSRPGIVHRLDKDTSGLMIVAKSERVRRLLQQQFKDRAVTKVYWALVEGHLSAPAGRIEAPIGRDPRQRKRMAVLAVERGGRVAVTEYAVVTELRDHTLVEARPKTGRTHQIRVHFAYIGHPIAGDVVYGRRRQRPSCPRQFLHASRLGFRLPLSGAWVEFSAPLPVDLQQVLDGLGTLA